MRRCPAASGEVERLGVCAQMIENPLDHGLSSMLAITLSLPAQRHQGSISMAKTRLSRCAQVRARCRSVWHFADAWPAHASFFGTPELENLSQGLTALALISANPGNSQVTLAQEMGLDTSAMVPLIDELEHRGWVLRQRSRNDRRRYRLIVTSSGEKALSGLMQSLDDVESSGLATLSASEFRIVSAALDRMYNAYRHDQLSAPEDDRRQELETVRARSAGASARARRGARRARRR